MGVSCGKCYGADLETPASPGTEPLTFNTHRADNLLISQVLSPQKRTTFSKKNLIEALDQHNIDSYFTEAQENLIQQRIGVRPHLLATTMDPTFPKLHKSWLKIDQHKRSDNHYIMYTYTHLTFSPDLYALASISFALSAATAFHNLFSHQVIECWSHNDLFVSVWRSTYAFGGKGNLTTFIYVKILKQLGNDEYFECSKDLKFTNLALDSRYQVMRDATANLGVLHTAGARYYTSKGKFYCQTYQEMDFKSQDASEKFREKIRAVLDGELFDLNMLALGLIHDSRLKPTYLEDTALFDSKVAGNVIQRNLPLFREVAKTPSEIDALVDDFRRRRSRTVPDLICQEIDDSGLTVSGFTEEDGRGTRRISFPVDISSFMDGSDVRQNRQKKMSDALLSGVESGKDAFSFRKVKKSKEDREGRHTPNARTESPEHWALKKDKKLFVKCSPPVDYDVVNESPRSNLNQHATNKEFIFALEKLKEPKRKA
jgi:hypothetical protein